MNKRILIFSFALVYLFLTDTSYSRTIRLATVDWPPYYGREEPNLGPISEVAKMTLELSGIKLKIDFMPRTRALTVVKAGTYDGILGAYQDSERDKFIHFSKVPIGSTDVVLFARKDKVVLFKSFKDLVGMRIGQMNGAIHAKEYDAS